MTLIPLLNPGLLGISASEKKLIKVLRLAGNTKLFALEGHQISVTCPALSANSTLLLRRLAGGDKGVGLRGKVGNSDLVRPR